MWKNWSLSSLSDCGFKKFESVGKEEMIGLLKV